MNRLGIPDGIPSAVSVRQVATAIGMDVRTLRGWVDDGRLAKMPTQRKRKRLIPTSELARLEADGWPVDWESLI